MTTTEAASRSADDASWSMLRFFDKAKGALIGAVAAGVVAGGANALLLRSIAHSLDPSVQATREEIGLYLVLCVVATASGGLSAALLLRISQSNLCRLRLWLSQRIVAAPLRLLQTLGRHRLMAALTSDIDSVIAAQETLPPLIIEGSKVVAVFVYLWLLSSQLFLVVSLFVVMCVIALQAPQQRALRWLERARETENFMFDHFRGATEGNKELKIYARRRRAFLDEELSGTARALKEQKVSAHTIFILVDRCAEGLFFLLLALIVFVASRFVPVSGETLTGFVFAILFLGGPLSVIGGALPKIGKGVVAMRNIEEMGLNLAVAAEDGAQAAAQFDDGAPARLELSGVTHQYVDPNGEKGSRLGPITVSIEPGELIYVTGGNGGGKTTLALVLLGLLTPNSGEIRLGGVNVTDANRESYRQSFSVVFADAYIFESLLGHAGLEMQARAEELLALLKLDGKLRIDGGRFSTVELSRGERKRLALLIACLEDRAFYLFDEWAAEQDPQFREIFYTELLPDLKARGKTVIVISHDDRYFDLADRIFHLNAGMLEVKDRGDAAHAHAQAARACVS